MRNKNGIAALMLAVLLPACSFAAQPPPPSAPAPAVPLSANAARQRQETATRIRQHQSELNMVTASLGMHGLTDQERRTLTQQASSLKAAIDSLHAQLQAIR